MSSRNIKQLKSLALIFCEKSNSNLPFRNYLCSQLFQSFENKSPEVQFNYYLKSLTNPRIVATYINGYVKEIDMKKKTMEEIHNEMIYVVSSFGRNDVK